MKTTMKNHAHFYKIKRAVGKITMQLAMASLVLVFVSCEKEEIFEPNQQVQEIDESVKGTARIVPKLSLDIRLINKNTAYDELRKNLTVSFNGIFWSAAQKTTFAGRVPQIWSSPNGSDWRLIRNNPFPVSAQEMVVYNSKIWVIGYSETSRNYQIYNSSNGYSWTLVTASSPFALRADRSVVVFDNKLFVLEAGYAEPGQKIYSSSDGINWTLENANAFPMRHYGTAIVFKDAMYYMGGRDNGSTSRDNTYKSTNGRDWSEVPGATPSYIRPTEDFPAKYHHAVVVHNNAVWLTGGAAIDEDAAQNKDIWVSGDMENWEKYTGHVKFRPLSGATLLSYKNKILLLGGNYFVESGGRDRAVPSKSIWSIKPKSSAWIPVEIPRDDIPTIPRF